MNYFLLLSLLTLSFSTTPSGLMSIHPISHFFSIKNMIITNDQKFSLESIDLSVEKDGELKDFHIVGGSELEYQKAIEGALAAYAADICEVSITLTVNVTVQEDGVTYTATATGSVNAPCDGVVAATNKLRASLVELAIG